MVAMQHLTRLALAGWEKKVRGEYRWGQLKDCLLMKSCCSVNNTCSVNEFCILCATGVKVK